MSEKVIDINLDMGEGFGRWEAGRDEETIKYVSSVSIACGFHAGDPVTMRRSVQLAIDNGVSIGAHPGLPDLLGFGRRYMRVDPDEVVSYIVYQVGALKAFVEAAGGKLHHVKPHGALYAMAETDELYARAVVEALKMIDPTLSLLIEEGTAAYKTAVEAGVPVIAEAFPDLNYSPEGRIILERKKEAWPPAKVAERVIQIVNEGTVTAIDGTKLRVKAESVCIHGDAPNAVEILKEVRARLAAEGITVRPA